MRRSDFLYTAYYCEENVWHLAADPRVSGDRRSAVFISNRARACALWQQRASQDPAIPVLWDYHVILLCDRSIYDLDTRLPFPCDAKTYLDETFPAVWQEPPRFRVVDASVFLKNFASDRSHMKKDGEWSVLPPKWPAIVGTQQGSNLMRFVEMDQPFLGEVLGLEEMYARISR